MLFRLTAGTNVGLVRTNNEDNFIVSAKIADGEWFVPEVTNDSIELDDSGCVFCVADGMGGMNAGEVASALAVAAVKREFSEADIAKVKESDITIKKFLFSVIAAADRDIKAKVKEDEATSGMGTTIVLGWVIGNVLHVVWCGDSRAYVFNPASGLVRITKDHSYVQHLVDNGKLDAELAFDHPDSNIITRSLGDGGKALPEYTSRFLSSGDIILLCSDGLCGLCRDEEIMKVLVENTKEEWNISVLKNALINASLEAGGDDNITVAIFANDSAPDENDVSSNTTNDTQKSIVRKKRHRFFWIIIALLVCVSVILYFVFPEMTLQYYEYLKEALNNLIDFF